MPQNKYVVLKSEDAAAYLSPEQKQALLDILGTVAEGRRQATKTVGDLFFVLNMKDTYAQVAIEAYIGAVQKDGLADTNPAVHEVLDVAIDVRHTAMMNLVPKIPD